MFGVEYFCALQPFWLSRALFLDVGESENIFGLYSNSYSSILLFWYLPGWVAGWISWKYSQLSPQLKLELGLSLAIYCLMFRNLFDKTIGKLWRRESRTKKIEPFIAEHKIQSLSRQVEMSKMVEMCRLVNHDQNITSPNMMDWSGILPQIDVIFQNQSMNTKHCFGQIGNCAVYVDNITS